MDNFEILLNQKSIDVGRLCYGYTFFQLQISNIDSDGKPFNWAPLMKGLMTVYWSDSEPSDAFVKVYTHHHWFYIKNSDTIPIKLQNTGF